MEPRKPDIPLLLRTMECTDDTINANTGANTMGGAIRTYLCMHMYIVRYVHHVTDMYSV